MNGVVEQRSKVVKAEAEKQIVGLKDQLQEAEANAEDGATGDHTKANAAWLTGVRCKRTEGADIECGVSADQLAAQVLGKDTVLPSLGRS